MEKVQDLFLQPLPSLKKNSYHFLNGLKVSHENLTQCTNISWKHFTHTILTSNAIVHEQISISLCQLKFTAQISTGKLQSLQLQHAIHKRILLMKSSSLLFIFLLERFLVWKLHAKRWSCYRLSPCLLGYIWPKFQLFTIDITRNKE